MFAVTVQSVSIQQLNVYVTSQFTRTSNSFAVVNVVKISNVKNASKVTLRGAQLLWDLKCFNFLVCLCCYCKTDMCTLCRLWHVYTVELCTLNVFVHYGCVYIMDMCTHCAF